MSVCIEFKWSGQNFVVPGLPLSSSLLELQQEIFSLTDVLPARQKFLGKSVSVKKMQKLGGKEAAEEVSLEEILGSQSPRSAFAGLTVMGSTEASIAAANPPDVPEGDLEEEVEEEKEEPSELWEAPEVLTKIQRRVDTYKINVRTPFRPGLRPLLVLDIDYTLFDHRSTAETAAELARPFLHEFLEKAAKHFDIAIWSATNMKWIETKMDALRVSSHPNFDLNFYVCSRAMVSVYTEWKGKKALWDVKPLQVIWELMPDRYGPHNTLHVDDLSRNFMLNPSNGVKIKAFRNAHSARESDSELLRLGLYLEKVGEAARGGADVRDFKPRKWERYV